MCGRSDGATHLSDAATRPPRIPGGNEIMEHTLRFSQRPSEVMSGRPFLGFSMAAIRSAVQRAFSVGV